MTHSSNQKEIVSIVYTNYRGETAESTTKYN